MADEFIEIGVTQLEDVARQLKALGDGALRKELLRGLGNATKPLKLTVRAGLLASLPKSGGLNEWAAAGARVSTRTRMSGRTPGVRIAVSMRGHDMAAIDRGRLRHPVHGNRRRWVTQQIIPGAVTAPLVAGANNARSQVLGVVEEMARRLASG